MPREQVFKGSWNRVLQIVARFAPGRTTWRVRLHRWRGVKIGKGVSIGYDAIIETGYPHLVTLKDGSSVGIRATIIAHNFYSRETRGVVVEEDASVGLGAIILPNVIIGKGAIVAAGSVVTKSVPPMTMVQGNPAVAIAKLGVPLRQDTSMKEFSKHLKPIRS
jgi:acetyltransferase-like isoleucine patch superfamily enzyme